MGDRHHRHGGDRRDRAARRQGQHAGALIVIFFLWAPFRPGTFPTGSRPTWPGAGNRPRCGKIWRYDKERKRVPRETSSRNCSTDRPSPAGAVTGWIHPCRGGLPSASAEAVDGGGAVSPVRPRDHRWEPRLVSVRRETSRSRRRPGMRRGAEGRGEDMGTSTVGHWIVMLAVRFRMAYVESKFWFTIY